VRAGRASPAAATITAAAITAAAITAAAITGATLGTVAPSEPAGLDDARALAAAGELGPDAAGSFDGRLYPDPDTGCIERWSGDDGAVRPPRDDIEVAPVPDGVVPPVLVQDAPGGPAAPDGQDQPSESDELFPRPYRGPWPSCEGPAVRIGEGDPQP
jgi:hypothetical protein